MRAIPPPRRPSGDFPLRSFGKAGPGIEHGEDLEAEAEEEAPPHHRVAHPRQDEPRLCLLCGGGKLEVDASRVPRFHVRFCPLACVDEPFYSPGHALGEAVSFGGRVELGPAPRHRLFSNLLHGKEEDVCSESFSLPHDVRRGGDGGVVECEVGRDAGGERSDHGRDDGRDGEGSAGSREERRKRERKRKRRNIFWSNWKRKKSDDVIFNKIINF